MNLQELEKNASYFPTREAALSARDELGSRLDVLLEIEE